MSIESSRIRYFDLLRTVAIFFVIVIHCVAPLFTTLPVNSRSWLISNLFESISRWAVPVFVMISGALLLNKKRDFKTFFKKNILKIVIILISWNFIYAVINQIKSGFSPISFVTDFVDGHYHLWFLYMLTGLYLITPFLKLLINNPKKLKLFLIISFFFGILLPQLSNILSAIPSDFNTIGQSLKRALENTGFGNLIGYSFYYVMGYYIHNKTFTPKNKKMLYTLGLIGLAITFFATWLFSLLNNSSTVIFLKDLTINNVLFSIAIFTYAKHRSNKNIISSFLINISKYSLGIYAVHILVLENFFAWLPNLPIYFEVPIKAISCFLISLIITFCLRKIPIVRKII